MQTICASHLGVMETTLAPPTAVSEPASIAPVDGIDTAHDDNVKRINLMLERGNFKGLSHHTGLIRAMVGETSSAPWYLVLRHLCKEKGTNYTSFKLCILG